MPTLSIRFLGGHYHATPWENSPNEGAVEWPPSPWRILRAFIATGYAKLAEWRDGIIPDQAKVLINKLASTLPVYRLPKSVGAHARHYMPIKGKTTLVLDAYAVTGIDHLPLLVYWDVKLNPEEEKLFAEIAGKVGYIGRAESWTECELVPDEPVSFDWAAPCDVVQSESVRRGWAQIPLIAPMTAKTYEDWRQGSLEKIDSGKKHSASMLKKFDNNYPADLMACLQTETGWFQSKGWSQPPGSRFVLYWRSPLSTIGVTVPEPSKPPVHSRVPVVLLALACGTQSRSPLPVRARILPQAELFHRTLASLVGKWGNSQSAAELLGVDSNRSPITGHRHAHILPLSLLKSEPDNHLDHILIWAPGGLGDSSQQILHRIRKTYMKGGVGELQVRMVGSGTIADFKDITTLVPMFGMARVWQSITPLILPRYRKASGRNTPDNQIIDELKSRGLPAPVRIEWLRDEAVAMRHYVRLRHNSRPPEDFGYAVRLTFTESVSGPICLGYASHFGLGLFTPVSETR